MGAGWWVLRCDEATEPVAIGRQMAQELWLSALGREQSCWESRTRKRREAAHRIALLLAEQPGQSRRHRGRPTLVPSSLLHSSQRVPAGAQSIVSPTSSSVSVGASQTAAASLGSEAAELQAGLLERHPRGYLTPQEQRAEGARGHGGSQKKNLAKARKAGMRCGRRRMGC